MPARTKLGGWSTIDMNSGLSAACLRLLAVCEIGLQAGHLDETALRGFLAVERNTEAPIRLPRHRVFCETVIIAGVVRYMEPGQSGLGGRPFSWKSSQSGDM